VRVITAYLDKGGSLEKAQPIAPVRVLPLTRYIIQNRVKKIGFSGNSLIS
jgi:hypothetical protein